MKKFLNALVNGETFNESEAFEAITLLATGEANSSQAAAFLMGIQQKGITPQELSGFRKAMLDLSIKLDLSDFEAMDVCGTGGDGKNTFNISTTSAFIVAGAGVKVAKHGNHGVSSAVGSSTVLEYLGIPFTNDTDILKKKMDIAGICYLHAPLFHPAMKSVAPIRKDLGIKTLFNIMGPLINPAQVQIQMVGVSDLKTFDLYSGLFRTQDIKYAVVHALDGYDEISLTGDFKVADKKSVTTLSPDVISLPKLRAEQLHGGNSLEESASIMMRILKGEGSAAQISAVLANAGLAISVAKDINIEAGIALAKESLESKRALVSLKKLVE